MSLPRPAPSTEVLVTGASSGIGTELARRLAARGHHLAIVARRRDRLDLLAEELRAVHGVKVTVHARDLSHEQEREALVDDVTAAGRQIVGLCNCAGFGTSGRFMSLPLDRELEQVEVNSVAIVALSHVFGNQMVRHGTGAILNVASIAAFQPLPGLATYAATKAFVQTFSEALHEELRGSGVSCTVLCPGPVPTEWADIAGAQSVMFGPARVSPKSVAQAAVHGMEQGRRTVVPGIVPKAMAAGGRFAPRTILLPAARLTLGGRLGD
jgi:short-subunit dehydrogenase